MTENRYLIKDKDNDLFLDRIDFHYQVLDFDFVEHGMFEHTENKLYQYMESCLTLKILQIFDCMDCGESPHIIRNHENSLEHSEELKELLDRDLVVYESTHGEIRKFDLQGMIDDILVRIAKKGFTEKEDEYLCEKFHRGFLRDFIKGKNDGKIYCRIPSNDEELSVTEDEYILFKLSFIGTHVLVDQSQLISKWKSLLPKFVFDV